MPIRKVTGCSFTQASSRSLGERAGQRSSSSWVVTKDTSLSSWGRAVSWGNTARRVAWVSPMALTMARTVSFR